MHHTNLPRADAGTVPGPPSLGPPTIGPPTIGPVPPDGTSSPLTFDQAFSGLYPGLVRVAFRIVGSRAVAEEVAQEAFYRAYLRWDAIPADRVAPWVTKVATNAAIDVVRRRDLPSLRARVPEPASIALRLDLVAAVARLPRRQREAVTLRFIGDLTEVQTARAMGVGVSAVKTHTRRGLAALRRIITDLDSTLNINPLEHAHV